MNQYELEYEKAKWSIEKAIQLVKEAHLLINDVEFINSNGYLFSNCIDELTRLLEYFNIETSTNNNDDNWYHSSNCTYE